MKVNAMVFVGMILALLCGVSSSFAQEYEDVIYLTDGGVRRGMIIEQIPGESVKLKTAYGEVFVIVMSDISKIVKEEKTSLQTIDEGESFTSRYFGEGSHPLVLGFEGGVGLSSLRGNGLYTELTPGVGFSFGMTMQKQFTTTFSLVTNIAYENRSQTAEEVRTDERGNSQASYKWDVFKSRYVMIPLLGRLTYGDKVKFYGNFGPYFGYLLRHKENLRGWRNGYKTTWKDITDDMKRLDLGMTSGLGTAIKINEGFLFTLEIRNSVGLLNTTTEDGTIKTNNTSFLVGIKKLM